MNKRNSDNYATKIISPYDEETILTINSNGYLESLKTSPDVEWKMEYKENGLLTKFTNPKDNSSQFY